MSNQDTYAAVKLQQEGPFLLVEVAIQGHDVRLIVDSGSTGSVIAEAALASLNIEKVPDSEGQGLTATQDVALSEVLLSSFDLGPIHLEEVSAVTMPLGDVLQGTGMSQDVVGILGRDLLVATSSVLSLGESLLYIPAANGEFELPKRRHQVALELFPNGFMTVNGEINGEPCRLLIDSGAPGLVLHQSFGHKLLGSSGALPQSLNLDSFRLGGAPISQETALLADLSHLDQSLQNQYEKGLQGLLGLQTLVGMNALLDVAENRLFF